ncbi:MAG TPA: barstar family protein [Pyrinomonadaceae bacterium]|nr:barstar family protein [Pyrinomonadaceae bacterium]
MPKNVLIDAGRISDWDSFHDTFAETLGFPGFYGRNMDAWIDCMTCLDDPDAGLTSTHVTRGDVIVLCMSDVGDFKRRCPEIYDALVECSAFVNYRRIERGEPAVLALSFND